MNVRPSFEQKIKMWFLAFSQSIIGQDQKSQKQSLVFKVWTCYHETVAHCMSINIEFPCTCILVAKFGIHNKCGFLLAEEQKKKKTFFLHTTGSLGTGLQGFQVTWLVRFQFCHLPLPDMPHPPNHPWVNKVAVNYYSLATFPCRCKTLSCIVMSIKVRLLGSAWHGSQRCVRNCTWIACGCWWYCYL